MSAVLAHSPVETDTARHYEQRDCADKFEQALKDDPVWDYLSRKEQQTFGWTAMSIAQENLDDECEAGHKLVALLREYAPKAFKAMKEEAEQRDEG